MLFLILILHVLLLVTAMAAAVFGLWAIALTDLLAYFAVAGGLWVCRPKKYVSLEYSELKERQRNDLPVFAPRGMTTVSTAETGMGIETSNEIEEMQAAA